MRAALRSGALVSGVLGVVLVLGGCSSAGPTDAQRSPSEVTTDRTAVAIAPLSLDGCDRIPAPDGLGCEAAKVLVVELSAPLPDPLPADAKFCLVDRLQDLPPEEPQASLSGSVLRVQAVYDCEAFQILGREQQRALGLTGDGEQIRCLAGAIQGTGRDEFVSALTAGPDSETGMLLAEDFRDQCSIP